MNVSEHSPKPKLFSFKNQYCKQNDSLGVGAPTSATLAEIFVQYIEHVTIINILKEHIIDCFRYVSILIPYNMRNTKIDTAPIEFNPEHPKIKFAMKKETNCMTITNLHNQLTFDILRNPTCTDLIMPNDSCDYKNTKSTQSNA
jgi:hypothetical protein